MTGELVRVPYGDRGARDTAVLLLAAAEELGLPANVVKNTNKGFFVPPDVERKAFPPEPKKSTKKSTTPAKAQE